jgi:hypothetical protein
VKSRPAADWPIARAIIGSVSRVSRVESAPNRGWPYNVTHPEVARWLCSLDRTRLSAFALMGRSAEARLLSAALRPIRWHYRKINVLAYQAMVE